MNSADRFEFDQIRRDQTRVHDLVGQLDHRIDLLARHFEDPEPTKIPAAPPAIAVPPPLPSARSWRDGPPAAESVSPAPEIVASSTPVEPPPPQVPPPAAATNAEPLELRVGTYWMSRLGIVILLTGLVFLGNYAYHRIVPLLGAWGKLSLLALAGAALGGLGAWLERSREATRNFGRVLLAGGAATIYYTAYAAHFVDALRVIESPIIGGGLLLALTGAFVFYADRRRSEAVAVPAVLLAYYTSSINAIGTFTLFSNLVLTAVAVLFLVRHRWLKLSLVSLAATYGSYVLWKLGHLLHVGGVFGEFGAGIAFLALYWVLFTVAVFVAVPEAMSRPTRVSFLTLNNGAFFALAASHFTSQHSGSFWIFALSYGAVLLALAALAARIRTEHREIDGAYLAQGLTLVTVGIAAKVTGPQLAVILAVESAALLTAARRRHGWLYQIAAALCALAASGLAMRALADHQASPLAAGLPVIAALLFDAWWIKRLRGEPGQFSERALGFALLGLATFAALLWSTCPAPWQPTAFALVAVAALAALRFGLPEIAWPGQAFLAGALVVFVAKYTETRPEPWWLAAPLIVIAIGLMHWWQRQRAVTLTAELRSFPQLACAAVAVIAGVVWMRNFYFGGGWLVATSIAALATLVYGLLTRGWALAVVGQVFTLLSASSFIGALVFENVSRWAALAPVLNVAITAALAGFAPAEFRPAVVIRGYRLAALAMLAAWAFVYVPAEWRVVFYAGCAAAYILLGAATANRERTATGGLYAALALAFFWVRTGWSVTGPELLAILAIPASLRLGQRLCGDTPVLPTGRDPLVGVAMASLWLWVTRFLVMHGNGGQLTAAWAVLALLIFAAGLGLRERIYRLGGFAVLGLSIGRLFLVDVWRFDTLPRIVSFLVLGVVLLVLSFVYNRFAEALRRWL